MAENVAGWIGLQGQGASTDIQTGTSPMLPQFVQTVQARAQEERMRKERERKAADDIYGNIFKDMITINSPMLPARREQVLKQAKDLFVDMQARRGSNPTFNPYADSEISERLLRLRSDIKKYEEEDKNYIKDVMTVKANPLFTEPNAWFAELGSIQDPKKLDEILGEGNIYQPMSGYRQSYEKFVSPEAYTKAAPKFSVKVPTKQADGTIKYDFDEVVGWSEDMPGTKEKAFEAAQSLLSSGSPFASGVLEIAQKQVIEEENAKGIPVQKDPKVLGKLTLEKAQEIVMDNWKNKSVKESTTYGNMRSTFGRAGSIYNNPDGTYSIDQSVVNEIAKISGDKAYDDIVQKEYERINREVAKYSAGDSNEKKAAREFWMKKSEEQRMEMVKANLANRGIVPKNAYEGKDLMGFSVTLVKPQIQVGDFKGVINGFVVDENTDEIVAVKAFGKKGNDKTENTQVFDVTQSDVRGQVMSKMPSFFDVYRDATGRELKGNVSVGEKQKGGTVKGSALQQNKPNDKQITVILNGKKGTIPESKWADFKKKYPSAKIER